MRLADLATSMPRQQVDAPFNGHMIGNVNLRIARPVIPVQSFGNEACSIEWLTGHGV